MWDEQKHSRFQQLRAQGEILTEIEQAELAQLLLEVEAAEAGYLVGATEGLRQEREVLESKNRALERLALRKQALVSRLRDFLADAQAERQAIEGELAAMGLGSQDRAAR